MSMRMLTAALALVAMVVVPVAMDGAESDSTNYILDVVALDTNGGGDASSTNYSIRLTIGQSVIGETNSAGYSAELGLWHAMESDDPIFADDFESGDTSAWSSSVP